MEVGKQGSRQQEVGSMKNEVGKQESRKVGKQQSRKVAKAGKAGRV